MRQIHFSILCAAERKGDSFIFDPRAGLVKEPDRRFANHSGVFAWLHSLETFFRVGEFYLNRLGWLTIIPE
jgi:hypothetical protein